MLFLVRSIDKKKLIIKNMNKNIKNILREKMLKINTFGVEFSKKINRSIIQNNNVKNEIKIYSSFILRKDRKFSSKQHKICILTGKKSSVLKGFCFSRYLIKGLILNNKLTNIKKNNW